MVPRVPHRSAARRVAAVPWSQPLFSYDAASHRRCVRTAGSARSLLSPPGRRQPQGATVHWYIPRELGEKGITPRSRAQSAAPPGDHPMMAGDVDAVGGARGCHKPRTETHLSSHRRALAPFGRGRPSHVAWTRWSPRCPPSGRPIKQCHDLPGGGSFWREAGQGDYVATWRATSIGWAGQGRSVAHYRLLRH